MTATVLGMPTGGKAQPNDLDRRRVERALKTRRRYRYVQPCVHPVPGGYRIESACCSRNIDPEGGIVDIALLLFDEARGEWDMFRRKSRQGAVGVGLPASAPVRAARRADLGRAPQVLAVSPPLAGAFGE